LAAGGDKQQVFLTVVVKTEIVGSLRGGWRQRHRRSNGYTVETRMGFAGDEGAHALCRIGRNPPTETQAADELAVVHGETPERRFGDGGAATIIGDLAKHCLTHRTIPR